jgi:tRNA-2-methylthio-N6-dimethylallyladenosine synthase
MPWSLARLLRHLSRTEGLARLRYTTSHPRDMTGDLIAAHGDIETLMPYLHLPVQSGSDRVLRAMNRSHTRDDYLGIVDRIRRVRPDIALSSDFIVGFPGETDGDFEQTIDLVHRVGYAQSFSFKYSARPGTPAAAMTQIPDAVKAERLSALQALLNEQARVFNRSCGDRVLPVLFDRRGREAGQGVGRSPYLQPVHVDGAASLIGELHDVRIAAVLPNSLKGALDCAHRRQEPAFALNA